MPTTPLLRFLFTTVLTLCCACIFFAPLTKSFARQNKAPFAASDDKSPDASLFAEISDPLGIFTTKKPSQAAQLQTPQPVPEPSGRVGTPEHNDKKPLALMQPYQESIEVIIRPYNSIFLSIPHEAKVKKIHAFDGDSVRKGQVLITLDSSHIEAELRAVKSSLADLAKEFANQPNPSKIERALMAEKMQRLTNEISALEEKLTLFTLQAPFTGKITDITAAQEQVYPPNVQLIEIAEQGLFKIECTAPSRYLEWLAIGAQLEIHLHEKKEVYRARVRRVSGKIDPEKRAIKVYAAFESEPKDLLPGMSGTALIIRPATR